MKDPKKRIRKSVKVLIVLITILIFILGITKIAIRYHNKKIDLIQLVEVQENNDLTREKSEIVNNQKFVHISIDDFIDAFQDITMKQSEYNSVFDNALFGQLKELHDKYGMVISCYTYYQNGNNDFNLSMCTEKFANEFKENAKWLKFGFHTNDGETDYEYLPASTIEKDYNKVVKELLRITGSEQSIDKVIRLQNYRGNEEALKKIKNSNYGIRGVLGADDTRRSYYLNDSDTSYLYLYDYFKDANNIRYFKTDIRIEKISSVQKALEEIEIDNANDTNQILTIFTHEWKIYEDDQILKKLDELCEQLKLYGYEFDFLMERVNNIEE